jgi:sec-independent protein translocase protein TatA
MNENIMGRTALYPKGHPGKLKILSCSINSVTMELAVFQMSIGASEWGIIILLVVLVIMGSNGFSGLARLLGRAVGEYDKARDMFRNEKDYSASGESFFPSVVPQIKGPVGTEREKLKIVAKALGIEESELTDDQLRSLISRRIQKP